MKGLVWMGYFDDQELKTNEYNRYNPKPPKKTGYFLSGFIGSIIGGLIVALTIMALNKTDLLPINQSLMKTTKVDTTVDQDGDGKKEIVLQNIAYNVDTDVTKAVDSVIDAVVGISNFQDVNLWEQASETGTGSGVIYKKEENKAYIVTNHHVIEGADFIEVTLSDGTKVEAELLGSDMWTDLAVLVIDGEHVKTVAQFGDSDQLKLGEPVLAIGNPLGLEFAGSITQGIISGLERTVPIDFNNDGYEDWNAEVLQTDAAINPGNSGGALINIAGQVIGINSMKIAEQEVEGIGFSIPTNIAIPIIEDLEETGAVKRPYMGVQLQDISDISTYHRGYTLKLPKDVKGGLVISDVVLGSPAQKAGLRKMDVIVKLDNVEIESMIDLRKHLYNKKNIGDSLKVGFYRNGEYQEVTVVLSEES